MRVFAEYIELSNGHKYRKKTLLKLGDAHHLIGSAILINPGSAEPISTLSADDEKWLNQFYLANHSMDLTNLGEWREFSCDATMRFLAKIFNGSYIGQETALNGVIQLFNCSYYKNQHLNETTKCMNEKAEFKFMENAFLTNKPVYFGWGNEGKIGSVCETAKAIFNQYDLALTPIYDPEFQRNAFYHPMYVNRSYKSNKKTQKLLADFYHQVNNTNK